MENTAELLVATMNSGKIRELHIMLDDLPLQLRGLDEFKHVLEVPETADSFTGNAQLKAQGYARQTKLWTLADDSGLEVEALGRAPGVYSARYGGVGLTDSQRQQLLLSEMRDIPLKERRARFVCAMAIANPAAEIVFTTEGFCPGAITFAPAGGGGFGYDPIFVPEGYDNTFGELPATIKNKLSHRARALAKAREFLAHKLT